MNTSTRYYTLDHWRGLACLMVVVSHTGFEEVLARHTAYDITPLGTIGVAMFFAISGYCIAAAVESSRKRNDSWWAFMKRRFRRIFPPYWAAMLMTLVYVAIVGLPSQLPAASVIVGNLTLTETWRGLVVGPEGIRLLVGQAWTLCHEEQFYLACGLLLLLPQRLFVPAAVAICGVTLTILATNRSEVLDLSGIAFAGSWLAFAPGVFVFHALHSKYRWQAICCRAAVCLVFACAFLAWRESVVVSVACLFSGVMLALYRFDAAMAGIRALKWLQWCGTISYSLYLTHVLVSKPTLHWLRDNWADDPFKWLLIGIPACAVASLLLAWPFHVFVERRFMPGAKPVGIARAEE